MGVVFRVARTQNRFCIVQSGGRGTTANASAKTYGPVSEVKTLGFFGLEDSGLTPLEPVTMTGEAEIATTIVHIQLRDILGSITEPTLHATSHSMFAISLSTPQTMTTSPSTPITWS